MADYNFSVTTNPEMLGSSTRTVNHVTANESNVTTDHLTSSLIGHLSRVIEDIPPYGYPGPLFSVIHLSALTSLSISLIISLALIIFLCACHDSKMAAPEMKTKNQNGGVVSENKVSPTRLSFWKWSSGERLVIYLAITDLAFSLSHTLDHAYMFAVVGNPPPPPDLVCSIFGFFLQEFIFAQWFIVLFSAISACSLVVFGKKLHIGRWDWRLITAAFGIPAVNGAVAASFGLLGQSGVWCFIDLRTSAGQKYSQVISSIQILCFGIIALAYGAIWIKIKQTIKLVDANAKRYNSSAKVMMIFVVIFILQWWSLVLFTVWALVGTAPAYLPVLPVILCNLGGVYDCAAYTIIRRRLQHQAKTQKTSGDNLTKGSDGRVVGSTSTVTEDLSFSAM